jgi:hypothetical protein
VLRVSARDAGATTVAHGRERLAWLARRHPLLLERVPAARISRTHAPIVADR